MLLGEKGTTARTFGDCGAFTGDAKFNIRLFAEDGCPIRLFLMGVYAALDNHNQDIDGGNLSWKPGDACMWFHFFFGGQTCRVVHRRLEYGSLHQNRHSSGL
jgi:hypothetical protein